MDVSKPHLAPVIRVIEDDVEYFSGLALPVKTRDGDLTAPLDNEPRRQSAVTRAMPGKQSTITNVVVPSHLLHAITSSSEYTSVTQERKRLESRSRADHREQFDVAAFANCQTTAVLRALGQRPTTSGGRSRKSSMSLHKRRALSRDELARPSTAKAPAEILTVRSKKLAVHGTPRTPGSCSPAWKGSTRRKSGSAATVERPSYIALPSPGLAIPEAAFVRKKSTVTFSDLPTPTDRAIPLRKKSVMTFSSPSGSAYHTPLIRTPLSELPPSLLAKSTISITHDVDISYEEKSSDMDVKGFLSQDYFGDFSLHRPDVRRASHTRGPLDTPSTMIPETPGKPTGWRWGNARKSVSGTASIQNLTRRNTSINAESQTPRRSSWIHAASVWQDTMTTVYDTVHNAKKTMRRGTMHDIYDRAKLRGREMERSRAFMVCFKYFIYALILAVIYFILIGMPLWHGTAYWLWYAMKFKLTVHGTWAIFIGIAIAYAYAPLLVFFEPNLLPADDVSEMIAKETPGVKDTCLLIPCYKSETILGPTLLAATRIFPAAHIFVVANGNSPTPLDDTESVCQKYGVNHVWSPIGSKIVAQFVGCHAAKRFKNVLLIDDDCALPTNFPIVSDRLGGQVQCIGYAIKSVGPNSSRGTLAQQAQDIEYKLSGLQRELASLIGSALFPHGAISLWDREFLIKTFHQHPGFNVSEDWFFGHVARELGCRTKMCTSVFVETETPDSVFFGSGGARGGFGEMTVFNQRFTRWNFFFVNGMYYNLSYILFSWKLGWLELGTKLFSLQEVYETLLYLAMPFVVPITIYIRPLVAMYIVFGTTILYFISIVIFNEVHLRRKGERVPALAAYVYYTPYKLVLTLVNMVSCYYALFRYATYFAKRHPKVIEDEKAIGVVLQLEETGDDVRSTTQGAPQPMSGRQMAVTAIGAQTSVPAVTQDGIFTSSRCMTVTTLGPRLDTTLHGQRRPSTDAAALLSFGGRKISIPVAPGTEGMQYLSSSRAAPTSLGTFKNSLYPPIVSSSPRRVGSVGNVSFDDEKSHYETPRTDSDTVPPSTTGSTGRSRLFSVAELGDEADLGVDPVARRKSSWIADLARRVCGVRPRTRGDVEDGDLPEDMLDRLAEAQAKLAVNRVEVVEFLIDGGRVDAEVESQSHVRWRPDESMV